MVDVLVAATLTAMCTEPGVCAPGGGGYLTVAPSGGEAVTVDGSMAMPGLGPGPSREPVIRTVSMEYGGGITTEVGPGSVAVPGGFAALSAAHGMWGAMPWKEVVGSVADALDQGFPLPRSCHYYLGFAHQDVFGHDDSSQRALHDGDRLLDVGDTVVVEGMVESLRLIAEEGVDTFYRGDLARRIVSDLSARGSLLTATDLATYRAEVHPALVTDVGGWSIASTPPPAVGGVALTALLRLMALGDLADPSVWVDAQTVVFGLRDRHRTSPPPEAARAILDGAARKRSGATVSIAVAGEDGTVGAATMSGGYGSGVIPAGTGLWMNNSLGELELSPGSVGPGERLMSNMAPSVAVGGGRRIAVGSPGAERITSALAIVLALVIEGATIEEAIEHPRCHVEVERGTVAHEPGLTVGETGPAPRPFSALDMYFGGVTAAEVGEGGLTAHADSRRVGGVSAHLVDGDGSVERRSGA